MSRRSDPSPGEVGPPGPGAAGTGACALIAPFGGRLVDLVLRDPDERADLLERAQNLPVVPLSLRAQYDLEMLAVGAFSPLDRFMSGTSTSPSSTRCICKAESCFPSLSPCRAARRCCAGTRARSRSQTSRESSWPCSRWTMSIRRISCARCARCLEAGTAPIRWSSRPTLAQPLPGRPTARVRPAPSQAARLPVPHARGTPRPPRGHGSLDGGRIPDADPDD